MNAIAVTGSPGKRLVSLHRDALRAMRTVSEPALDKIELERLKLANRDEPLVDGTLESAAPWDEGITIAQASSASRAPKHARYLYGLIRAARPNRVLELGTNLGISGAYIAAALAANGDGGALVTMDRSGYRQRLAGRVIDAIGLSNVEFVLGDFEETFETTMASRGPFDFAFIDGNHQLEPTLHYANAVCQQAGGPVDLVFDDIRWSDGMIEAWHRLSVDSRMSAALDLHSISLCTMVAGRTGEPVVSQPLRAEFL